MKSIYQMSVKELRQALEPYGTRYRLRLKRHELEKALREIQAEENNRAAQWKPTNKQEAER